MVFSRGDEKSGFLSEIKKEGAELSLCISRDSIDSRDMSDRGLPPGLGK